MEVRSLRKCVVPGMVGVPQHLCMKAMCEVTENPENHEKHHAQSFSIINYLLKEDMVQLRTFALWFLLAFLGQQVSPSFGVRSKNREADKTVTPAPGRVQRSGNKSAASGRGKFFISEDNMRCTWGAKDVANAVRLTVKCENPEARIKGGVTDLGCQYNAKPQLCRGYQSDPKGFWKQVARAFKKLQGKVCKDDRALVKAGMCKSAPRDAHFKLDILSSVVSAQSGQPETHQPPPPSSIRTSTIASPVRPTNCTGRVDVRKQAEEHCSDSWASLCAFFFSVLQSDEC